MAKLSFMNFVSCVFIGEYYFRNWSKSTIATSSLEYLPHSNFQKRIVSTETIRGNTVFENINMSIENEEVLVWRVAFVI